MPFARLLLALFAMAASAASLPAAAQDGPAPAARKAVGSVVATPHVRAELIAHAPDGIEAGRPVRVGLRIAHQPGWHTYWKNPGDSGLPTQLEWTLPEGLSAGPVDWPVPRRIPIGALANYGYEGTVLLPAPLEVTPRFKAPLFGTGEVTVRLHASWLVCRQECIPEEGDFALALPVRGSTAADGEDFARAQAARPQPVAGAAEARVADGRLRLTVDGLPAAARGRTLEFFPETGGVTEPSAALGTGWTQAWDGGRWTADIPLSAHRTESSAVLPAVLALRDAAGGGHATGAVPGPGGSTDAAAGADGTAAGPDPAGGRAARGAAVDASLPAGWRIEATVAGAWPPAAPVAAVPAALAAALRANADSAATAPAAPSPAGPQALAAALLGALLGGLILNLMPCVFPVLAIKVVGFAQHADDADGGRLRRLGGIAYATGVVASFLALGAALLALRAAGGQLGWGFQLQSPALVAALAALFTLLGLNLAGVFEFGRVPLPGGLAGARLRHPAADAFLSGVLAVAVASPCTAPFMGASLGLAIGLPAPQALAVFAAIGLGMALPYLAASWLPATARLLPRPGAWMGTFRRSMAFPMFGTVAWLVWVLGQQSGIDGAGSLLALLVAGAAVVWALTLHGRARRAIATVSIAAAAGLAWAIGPNIVRLAPSDAQAAASGRWQPWSEERVRGLVADGRPVFVDFTAAWCVTCQVNKQATLSDAGVLAALDGKRVALLRADWTRRDPAITAALRALGRSGVPVYVLHAPGRAPVVLTELLGRDEVKAAVAAL
jgi:thiol:disulfide interchange protein DsbD